MKKNRLTVVVIILTFITVLSSTESFAQCTESPVTVVPHYKPLDYLGQYALADALDMKDSTGTYVAIILKRTDDSKMPEVAYIEQSKGVTAAVIKAAKGVRVSLDTDGKRLVVEFLDKDRYPYFKSTLKPFDEK
jgi:hypothetical protein